MLLHESIMIGVLTLLREMVDKGKVTITKNQLGLECDAGVFNVYLDSPCSGEGEMCGGCLASLVKKFYQAHTALFRPLPDVDTDQDSVQTVYVIGTVGEC